MLTPSPSLANISCRVGHNIREFLSELLGEFIPDRLPPLKAVRLLECRGIEPAALRSRRSLEIAAPGDGKPRDVPLSIGSFYTLPQGGVMKRLALLAAVVLCSFPSLAGEFLINDSVAYGLRVTFSAPVTITYSGDVLPTVSPEGEAVEFLFSGARLPAWVGHGLIWTPTSARILSYKWLSAPPTTPIPDTEPTEEDPVEDQGTPAVTVPDVDTPTPEPEAGQDEASLPSAPDWSEIAYVRSYDRAHNDLKTVTVNGQEVASESAGHWGLPGSEIKGLKFSYVDEGVFILLETWEPTVQGSYEYGIAFLPESRNHEPFEIRVDPNAESVGAGNDTDLDLTAHVYLVSLDDHSLVLFMEHVLLPGGASVSSTWRQWTRYLVCYYTAGSQEEAYELERYVDFES